ncbi:MAG: ABC transporter permease, partial [Atopobiaceae bacterium]|nr:ABC transporter permease [Atopobiaceae bacterium]
MAKYILKRVGLSLLTLFLIVFILFVLVRIMPGNPFPSERMSADQIANKRAEMGLDDPILVQFGRYFVNLLHGDFGKGTSLYYGAPINTVLSTCISNSFRIGGLAILEGTAVGLLLGITAALNKGRFLDGFCTVFSILGVCVPGYVFLIFLQYFFSYKIPFFPYFFDPNRFLFSSILPSLSLS